MFALMHLAKVVKLIKHPIILHERDFTNVVTALMSQRGALQMINQDQFSVAGLVFQRGQSDE